MPFFFKLCMSKAENVAKDCQISRESQDEYAVLSQQRAEEAKKNNKLQAEIVPVVIKERKGDVIMKEDEFPKPDTSVASLSKLRPAFIPVSCVCLKCYTFARGFKLIIFHFGCKFLFSRMAL